MNTSQRKQYAKKCLLSGRTNTRGYDNCFESDDGDQVVRYLIEQAQYATPTRLDWLENDFMCANGKRYTLDGPEWKEYTKIRKSADLRDAIKRAGSWECWLYFSEYGTYAGYEGTA